MSRRDPFRSALTGLAILALAGTSAAEAAPVTYRNKIANNPARCSGGSPAVRVTVKHARFVPQQRDKAVRIHQPDLDTAAAIEGAARVAENIVR